MNYVELCKLKILVPSSELFTCKRVGLPLGFPCLFIQPALAIHHSFYLIRGHKEWWKIVKVVA